MRNYSYQVKYWVKNSEGKLVDSGVVTGITNSKDILASAFRQHPEILPATSVKLSYYEF